MIANLEQFRSGLTIQVVGSSGSVHTFNDWNLMQLAEMEISSPEPKTHVIDSVLGIDGDIDITEHFGDIRYKNRSVKYKFVSLDCNHSEWMNVLRTMNGSVHGRMCTVIADIDPTYYWKGRVYIEPESKTDSFVGSVVVRIDAEPRMYRVGTTSGGVL